MTDLDRRKVESNGLPLVRAHAVVGATPLLRRGDRSEGGHFPTDAKGAIRTGLDTFLRRRARLCVKRSGGAMSDLTAPFERNGGFSSRMVRAMPIVNETARVFRNFTRLGDRPISVVEHSRYGWMWAPSDLEEFARVIDHLAWQSPGGWRGQSNLEWPLDSGAARRLRVSTRPDV